MKLAWVRIAGFLGIAMAVTQLSWAHVTLQTAQTLRPKGMASISLNVPNERSVDNTKVTLTVPDAFLKAGGRVNRVQYPAGWTVTLEKADKPQDVLSKEKDQKGKRDAKKEGAGAGQDTKAAKTDADKADEKAMAEMRKKWITQVTFEGGAIPPDGFAQFLISFQLPEEAGKYRFPAVQTYADGKEVSWSELVEGAEHPAPTLSVVAAPLVSYSELPLPLSALALLVAFAGYFKKSRAPEQERAESAVLVPGLVSAGARHGE